jgi:RHS repeat-associated protein
LGANWAHYDGNGNVVLLTDGSGAASARYAYDAFGKLKSSSGPAAEANRYRFSTKPQERAAGLSYYGYRYYAPALGRWLSRDPLEEEGGVNLYVYCSNDAVNLVDPFGLDVAGTFDRKSGILTVIDNQTNKKVIVRAFSGNGSSTNNPADEGIASKGPIPEGKYLLGNAYSHGNGAGDNQWYRLYGPDGNGGYTYTDIPVKAPTGKTAKRGLFNLHTGLMSDGCITVLSNVPQTDPKYPTSKEYDDLKRLLDNTKPLRYKNDTFRGIIEVK